MMLLLATATLFAACGGSDDEAVTPAPQPQPQRMLTVEVSERPLQTEGTPKAPRRADAATTTETLNTFTMCVDNKDWYATLTKTNGKWTTSWPGGNVSKKWNFYAYNVGNEFVWNGGDPYVSFTMEGEVIFQKDFLVAKTAEAKSWSETGGKISLTFDHACAAVQFYVYKEESATYVVKDIQLQNVYKQGNYYFNDNSWKNLSTPPEFPGFTLTTGDITLIRRSCCQKDGCTSFRNPRKVCSCRLHTLKMVSRKIPRLLICQALGKQVINIRSTLK